MNESVVPLPPPSSEASELPEHRRHPVSILVFGSVIVVVQIIDFILGDRVSNIVNAAASGSERLIRILSLGGDALFLVVLAFGVGHAAHHHSRLAKGDEKGFPPVLLVAYLVIATINVLQNMVILVVTPTLQNASQTGLIIDLGLLFASNMLIFSLWYMLADAYLTGGAFDFPPDALRPDDPPRWVDYLSLSFNTQSTFGPTLEGVRRRPVKVLMMFQTSLSLVVLVVLIARIIKAPV
ncbi:MAG: hypothetical protein JHC66_06160 [Acidimicrobiia bacterium]|nr:hypothetical protein [Acidimicrobiia bacterium]